MGSSQTSITCLSVYRLFSEKKTKSVIYTSNRSSSVERNVTDPQRHNAKQGINTTYCRYINPRVTSNRLVETGHQSWFFSARKARQTCSLGRICDAPVLAVPELLSTLVQSKNHHKRGFKEANPVSAKSKWLGKLNTYLFQWSLHSSLHARQVTQCTILHDVEIFDILASLRAIRI